MSAFHISDNIYIDRIDGEIQLYKLIKGDPLKMQQVVRLLTVTPTEFASMVASVCPDGYERTFFPLNRIIGG